MGSAASLQLVEGFYGVNEALTDYRPGVGTWVATLIGGGADVGEARAVVDEAVRALARRERLDVAPEAVSLAGMEAARS
jgi:hypothetical protein